MHGTNILPHLLLRTQKLKIMNEYYTMGIAVVAIVLLALGARAWSGRKK